MGGISQGDGTNKPVNEPRMVALVERLKRSFFDLSRSRQQTIASEILIHGVGVHTGANTSMRLRPAAGSSGITFRRTDLESELRSVTDVAAHIDNVSDNRLATSIMNSARTQISTIEHLMAAFFGLGIDNVVVEIDGPEVPIMDGSAAPFIERIIAAGIESQPAAYRAIRLTRVVEVADGDRFARLEPAAEFSVDCAIEYDAPIVANQRLDFTPHNGAFVSEIGPARTFGFAEDVERMRDMGLARGGSLDNAIVVSGESVLNEGGLRYTDEFVRHKVLDCLGDFYLLGAPLQARLTTKRGGHALNHHLLKALSADKDAWAYTTDDADEGVAALAAAG